MAPKATVLFLLSVASQCQTEGSGAEAAGGAHLGDEMTEFTDTANRLSRYLHCIQLAAAYSQVD